MNPNLTVLQSMQQGDTCIKGGQYCCLYHQKRKIKIKTGGTFPRCDHAGLNCEGLWHMLKEIKEKTKEEIFADAERRRYQHYRASGRDRDFIRKTNEPKVNKWDLERW